MLRASSSSLLYGRIQRHRCSHLQQFVISPFHQSDNNATINIDGLSNNTQQRLLSFKAFADRNDSKSSKNWRNNDNNKKKNNNSNDQQQQQQQQRRGPQHRPPQNREGGYSGVNNNNRGNNAPASSSRPPPSNYGNRANNNAASSSDSPPWQQRQRRDAPKPPPSFGSSFRNTGNANGSMQRGNTHANNRQQQQHHQQQHLQQQTRPDGDLRDISQLRNTFMTNRNSNNSPREPWRNNSNNYNNPPSRPSPPPSYSRPSFSLSKKSAPPTNITSGEMNPTAAAAGVGSKFTPSHYKKKNDPPPPPSASSSSANPPFIPTIGGIGGLGLAGSNNNEVKSIEQVMKANAAQRKQDMEQRYRNAGERVPYNADEYGNPNPASSGAAPERFGWRNRGGSRDGNNNNNNNNNNNGPRMNNSNQRNWKGNGGPGGYARGGGRNQTYNQNRDPKWGRRQQQQAGTRQPFFGEQRKRIRKHLPPSMPTSVRLPASPMTLVDLSRLLRVRKRTLVRTLRALGEQVAYTDAKQDSYKIDVEMMEFICVELGIEPTKAEKKESDLEEAERRAMRHSREELDEDAKTEEEERYAALPPRSPVVSIMGHVDHGKTTLMDALRRRALTGENTPKGAGKAKASGGKKGKKKKGDKKSRGKGGASAEDGDVAGTEAGGITQVITAFEVPLPLEDGGDAGSEISTVTFLDTPGHAAFKKMRQSGSSATDVIVLVVAADDGISPQTIEIIDMYRSIARAQPQSISLVVTVSKIDKHGIDVDEAVMRIENQLMEQEIFTENVLAAGGDEGEFGACQLFPVSGITGEGLDDLVEGLALQSEIMDLRADEEAKGEGIVIDARMEKGLGVVADCVIRWGSVAKGDFVVSGTNGGRVKFLNDVGNKPLKKARPSQPVRIVGFKTLPKAGDPIVCAGSEEDAKELIQLRESELVNEERAEYEKEAELQLTGTVAKQGMMLQKAASHYGFGDENGEDGEDGEEKKKDDSIYIPVVIKADSHGTLDAVRDALVSIGTESKLDIVIDPVEMSTGVVTMNDVIMARESNAGIFVFGKVGIADKVTKNVATESEVEIRNHDIIYRLLEDAKEFFGKYLPVENVEKVHGKANVQAVFPVTDAKTKKSVSVAGLRVTEGHLYKDKSSRDGGEKPLSCFYRVLRRGEVVTDVASDAMKKKNNSGIIASSLRKVKEDVDSVRRGEECGLGLEGFNDLEEGDVVECYSIEEKRAEI